MFRMKVSDRKLLLFQFLNNFCIWFYETFREIAVPFLKIDKLFSDTKNDRSIHTITIQTMYLQNSGDIGGFFVTCEFLLDV